MQNSLFECDFDKDIESDYQEDPFSISKQQILEDILREEKKTESKLKDEHQYKNRQSADEVVS